jgi:hypothetical protein
MQLSSAESLSEIETLVHLISNSESVKIRNRLTARRSRLLKHVKQSSSDEVIKSQKNTIQTLRVQVNTLLGLLSSQKQPTAEQAVVISVDPAATEEPARPVVTEEPCRKLKKNATKTIQSTAGKFPKFPDLRFIEQQWVEAPPVFGCQSGTTVESTMEIMCEPENAFAANDEDMLYGSL